MLDNCYIVMIKVLRTKERVRPPRFKRRISLRILKPLMKERNLIFILDCLYRSKLIKDPTAMEKSKRPQGSPKQLPILIPKMRMITSIKKMTVKIMFMISVKLSIASLYLYHLSISKKVLKTMLIKMKRSKYLCPYSLQKNSLNLLSEGG